MDALSGGGQPHKKTQVQREDDRAADQGATMLQESWNDEGKTRRGGRYS